MLSVKLHIINCSDKEFIRHKINSHTYAFHLIYKRFEESSDSYFEKYIEKRFDLKQVEYRSIVQTVKELKEQEITNRKNKEERIVDLREELETEKDKHKIFKLNKKINRLKNSLNNNPVFGGRFNLQQITRQTNNKNDVLCSKYRKIFKENRKRFVYLMGEANQSANRFFHFNKLSEGILEYCPYKGKKIKLSFNPKRYKDVLTKLQELALNKDISISVSFDEDYIVLSYDNEKLNGYNLDETNRRIDVAEIKKQRYSKDIESQLIKECYKTYYDKQREHKLEGKLINRIASVDLNPTNIGFSVIDKIDDTYKVVFACQFDLSRLSIKIGKKSSSKQQKYQNNKRRYELTIIWKQIFHYVTHFKCSKFAMEDLSFKVDSKLKKEANRKVKNLWHRCLTENLINKYCLNYGIELVKVNACFSSFIGNIQHEYVDAVNASIEIGRRSLFKYEKDRFYPYIDIKDYDTLERKFEGFLGDAHNMTDISWVKLYKSLTNSMESIEFASRLRTALNELNNYSMFSIKNKMSQTNKYIYSKLNNYFVISNFICIFVSSLINDYFLCI